MRCVIEWDVSPVALAVKVELGGYAVAFTGQDAIGEAMRSGPLAYDVTAINAVVADPPKKRGRPKREVVAPEPQE